MSKVSNVLSMLELLSTGKKYSIRELSQELEVSPRMIRVYKDDLEKAGIYLNTVKGPYGGYVLAQELNIPKRFIGKDKIEVTDKYVFNTLSKAIKHKQKCYIEYTYNDNLTKRIIHPYEMSILNNEWGIAAYCESRKEIRHFYLNRISLIEILKEKY